MESLPGNNKVLAIYEDKLIKKISLPLFNEVPRKALPKDKKKTFKYVFNKIRLKKCASATISKPFPTYHVAYLGNVVTGWAKGEGCIEKPLATLWRNYIQSSRPDVSMNLTIAGGGLKAVTKNHGLTEYWAHRLTTCAAPKEFPRIFCWVYRHEGRRMRHELRCHAALCSSSEVASQIEKELKDFLLRALTDFKKDKLSKQNARLSLVNCVNENPSLPRRKILLGTGSHNYKPPLECSKSAPKLSSIEEIYGEEDDGDPFNKSEQIYKNILKSYEKANFLFEQGRHYNYKKLMRSWNNEQNKDNNRNNSKRARVEACNLHVQTTTQLTDPDPKINEQETLTIETEEEKCDNLYINNDINKVAFDTTSEPAEESAIEGDKKVDLDFKIGGEVLPAIKPSDKLPNHDLAFVNPIIGKGFLDQEQVSLVPVGETHSDFSSLKVYKKKSEGNNKDFAMFLSNENINQLENIFQAHCSFNGDRSEEEISNKFNSTLLV